MSASRGTLLGVRVRVQYDDKPDVYGVVRAISRRGHKVELDNGRVVYAAWWRLSRLPAP